MSTNIRILHVLACLVALSLPACSSNQGVHDQIKKQSVDEASKNLKIINWNVLYGFNHGQSVETGSRWICEQAPDVVALQELNGITAVSFKERAATWGHQYSAIHKENGFPVGLTSNAPIEVIERQVKGFHHGYLHCRTHDIHFFVVHFWPGKDHEAAAIIKKIKPLLDANQKVIVLGDFNSNSGKDIGFLASSETIEPLCEVVNKFESIGFVDLIYKHDPQAKYSCPSPITIPKWSSSMEVLESKRQRIDFIFADQILGTSSTSGTILISEELDRISDHYPIVVEFRK